MILLVHSDPRVLAKIGSMARPQIDILLASTPCEAIELLAALPDVEILFVGQVRASDDGDAKLLMALAASRSPRVPCLFLGVGAELRRAVATDRRRIDLEEFVGWIGAKGDRLQH
jgi:hypothetical protein